MRPTAATLTRAERTSGVLLGEHRELVHDDQQPGHWDARVRREVGVQGVDALAGRGEDTLAVAQLGLERSQGAVSELLVEVAHGPDRVRQPLARRERRSALEVDEDEGEARRVVAGSQSGDQRAQELALARTRRSTDEAVRAVPDEVLHSISRLRQVYM